MKQSWTAYLSGEIHTDWREQIIEGAQAADLPFSWLSPVTIHADSDDCGAVILGEENSGFWRDHKGASINSIRTRTFIEKSDVVIVRFGDQYRQWNAAFDAGFASAIGKPLVIIHDEGLTHALKEVDAAALAVAQTPAQIVEILRYVSLGKLKRT